ncbi:TPA: hypothetical protein ACOELV_001447 [Enterobacter bugandensis]|uniref:hypothetical protein n=1 Tax=Enterobacter bugandensis TaxID=881260 RepID=UPI0020759A0D|nr:hypothetical protein [Enterobacter bugandensis]MCM7391732.1 hypothetical protein [Enterobacter bugandensis]
MSDFYSQVDDKEFIHVIAEQFYLYMQTRDDDVVSSDFQVTTGQSAIEVAERMIEVITNQEFPQHRQISHDATAGKMHEGYPVFTLFAAKK